MDDQRVGADLEQYLADVATCKRSLLSAERRAALKRLNEGRSYINWILANLLPDHGVISGTSLASHEAALAHVRRAYHLVGRGVPENEDGDPYMFSSFSPLVITISVRAQWRAGNYRNAVGDVATNVSWYTQKRLGRYDISERDLMAQAFTDKPPKPGEPRLRCPGNPDSPTVQSQQQGAILFAMGAYQAFRNPAQHLTGDWNPITAFHYLAAFSTIAAWVDTWDVVKA
jgi:hypothetical protein